MVPGLKTLKVWTLYVHTVAQVNHRGLGMKIKTNCLRYNDLIPRHSQGAVARSEACPLDMQAAPSSIPTSGVTVYLVPIPPPVSSPRGHFTPG